MFGLFGGAHREISKAYQAMRNAHSPDDMLRTANEMLQLAEKMDYWPLTQPSRQKAMGIAYGTSGLAYLQLGLNEPHFSDQTIKALNKAIEYMQMEPDIDLAVAYLNLSSAYASRPSGSQGENIESSIKNCQNALDLLDHHDDVSMRFDVLSALATYYSERQQVDSKKDNLEKAKSLIQEALTLQSHGISQNQLAQTEMALGTIYKERVAGDPQDNITDSIKYLESALSRISKSSNQHLWALINANLSIVYPISTRNTTESVQLEKALAANTNALSVFTREHYPEKWANMLTDRATLITKDGMDTSLEKHNEAVALYEQALEVLNIDDYPQRHAHAMQNYSILIGSKINPDIGKGRVLSIQYARDALKSYDVNKDPISWAQAEAALGSAIFEARHSLDPDEYEEAITCFEHASKIITPDTGLNTWIMVSNCLSNAYAERKLGFKTDNIEKAIQIQTEALEKTDLKLFRKHWLGGMRGLALSYLDRFNGFFADNVEYAIVLIEEALIVTHDSDEPNERAEFLENLGDTLTSRVRGDKKENLERAASSLNNALDIHCDSTNSELITRLKLKLNHVNRELQDIAEKKRDKKENSGVPAKVNSEPKISTEEYIDRLKSYADSISKENHPKTWAGAQITIASALLRYIPDSARGDNLDTLIESMLAQREQSIPYYEKALSAIDQNHDPDGASAIFGEIGTAYYGMFLLSEAKDYGIDNLHKITEIDVPERSERASKYLSQSNQFYKRALELPCRGKHLISSLSLTCRVGESYFMLRDWNNAHDYFKQAAAIADQLLGDVESGQQDLQAVLESLGVLAEHAPFSALMLGNVKEAIELSEAGRARLLAKSLTLKALPLKEEDRSKINSLQNEMTVQEQRLISEDTFDRRTPLDEIIKFRKLIRETVSSAIASTTHQLDYQGILDKLVTDNTVVVIPIINNLAGQLLVFNKGINQTNVYQVDVEDDFALRKAFDSKVKGDHGSKALSHKLKNLKKQFGHSDVNNYPEEIVEELIEKTEDLEQTFKSNINTLSKIIVEPLASQLVKMQLKPDTKILLLAHGALSMLPINLADTEALGAPIIDHFELTFSPSLQVSHLIKSSKNKFTSFLDSATILSIPIRKDKVNNLKYAPTERNLVRSWFSRNKVIQIGYPEQKISEPEILRALDGSAIWHICAHAGFDDVEPLNSKIDLGIAQLSLRSIFNASSLKPPRLVVLSACETGLHGTNELPQEFIGMPTALLQLGAMGVIATQWNAGDLSTTLLMGKFYEFFMVNCLRPPEALRRSQLWLRDISLGELIDTIKKWEKEDRLTAQAGLELIQDLNIEGKHPKLCPYADPYYWGAFVYFGE